MGLDVVLIVVGPTQVCLACRTAKGLLLHCALAYGICDHLGSELVRGSEVNLVGKVQEEDVRFVASAHGRNIRRGRLGGIDGSGTRPTNLVNHVEIADAVFTDKHRFLRFIQRQDNQILRLPICCGQIISAQSGLTYLFST